MVNTLYEIAGYYSEFLEKLNDSSIEVVGEVYETLDAIDVSITEKVESIGDIIRNYQAEAAALKAEAKRLNERAVQSEKAATKLLGYVESVMGQNNFDELKGLKHTFKFSESISLKSSDWRLVPKHYLKPQDPTVDIAGLKENFKKTYDEKNIKLVTKPSKKPKGTEMLFTDLNDAIRDMGLEFVKNRKLNMK